MAEVIFAIMVLGIGLILLAAAFPVGIKQGEKTQDATNAALIAQHALVQITKVVAAYTRPDPAWNPLPGLPLPSTNYAGRCLTMGLLDGAMHTDGTSNPVPDLRAKLIYPSAGGADAHPQDPTVVDASGLPVLGVPTANDTYLDVWGYRFDYPATGTLAWYENVQWVLPADRRYYWYAFYRQMYEDPAGYLNPLQSTDWTTITNGPARRDAVKLDHITRRTYRVSIVACRVPSAQNLILTPEQIRRTPTNNTPADYAAQWTSLAPIRFPDLDANVAALPIIAYPGTENIIRDTAATGGPLYTRIQSGQIKRGGIVVDGWANVYQIVDVGANQVRLDRDLPVQGSEFKSVLPLWFNPNAIAVFPTIVTKQADLP